MVHLLVLPGTQGTKMGYKRGKKDVELVPGEHIHECTYRGRGRCIQVYKDQTQGMRKEERCGHAYSVYPVIQN